MQAAAWWSWTASSPSESNRYWASENPQDPAEPLVYFGHATDLRVSEIDLFQVEKRLGLCQVAPVSDAKEQLRATVEQIVWKGDFAYSRTVTGKAQNTWR